jgi:hypothetical protein
LVHFFWRSKRTEEGFSLMSSPKANEHYLKKRVPLWTPSFGKIFYFTSIGLPNPAFSSSLSWVFASPATT